MKIELQKIDHLTHKITVTRTNHTSASVVLDTKTYFLHDLCHYCVEMELKYQKGFWGMLSLGHDFSELNGKENPLTEELKFIEKIVGPIQSIVSGHLAVKDFENSTAYLNSDISKFVSPEILKNKITEYLAKWNALNYGQSLILHFDLETL